MYVPEKRKLQFLSPRSEIRGRDLARRSIRGTYAARRTDRQRESRREGQLVDISRRMYLSVAFNGGNALHDWPFSAPQRLCTRIWFSAQNARRARVIEWASSALFAKGQPRVESGVRRVEYVRARPSIVEFSSALSSPTRLQLDYPDISWRGSHK